jgi:hypothetical protein
MFGFSTKNTSSGTTATLVHELKIEVANLSAVVSDQQKLIAEMMQDQQKILLQNQSILNQNMTILKRLDASTTESVEIDDINNEVEVVKTNGDEETEERRKSAADALSVKDMKKKDVHNGTIAHSSSGGGKVNKGMVYKKHKRSSVQIEMAATFSNVKFETTFAVLRKTQVPPSHVLCFYFTSCEECSRIINLGYIPCIVECKGVPLSLHGPEGITSEEAGNWKSEVVLGSREVPVVVCLFFTF